MRLMRPLLCLLFLAAMAIPASAQFPGISFGIGGGPTLATGQLGDVVDTGFHVQGVGELSIPLLPIGVRATADYNRLAGSIVNYNQFSGTVNGKVGLPLIPVLLSPYATAGIGIYHGSFSDPVPGALFDQNTTEVGANVGIGIELNLLVLSAYAEARIHNLFGSGPSGNVVPLTIGITF